MAPGDKELLFKDICARLPYGVKVDAVFINPDTKERKSCGIEVFDATSILMIRDGLGEFKPYLFPLTNMTEEQSKIYHELIRGMLGTSALINFEALEEFFHKNHIDYRGLVPMGLAIDATGLNIY